MPNREVQVFSYGRYCRSSCAAPCHRPCRHPRAPARSSLCRVFSAALRASQLAACRGVGDTIRTDQLVAARRLSRRPSASPAPRAPSRAAAAASAGGVSPRCPAFARWCPGCGPRLTVASRPPPCWMIPSCRGTCPWTTASSGSRLRSTTARYHLMSCHLLASSLIIAKLVN